ncbi:MAG: hypothetical protein V4525_16065 [Pseudomonadota bacterium]
MSLTFLPLLTLGIDHPYYLKGCRDFTVVIPEATRELLRGGRLLTREIDGKLLVVYETDDEGVPRVSLAGQTLMFGLRLTNPYFGNVTNPVLSNAASALTPFYANTTTPSALDPVKGVLRASQVFDYTPSESSRPVSLKVTDAAANTVLTQNLLASEPQTSLDLRALPRGLYTLTEHYEGGLQHSQSFCLEPELYASTIWGVLAITINAAFYSTPPVLTIPFSSRQEALKYYVVAKNYTSTEFEQLTISDGGFNDDARPELKFDKIIPAVFSASDLSPSLLGDSSTRVVLFKSQTPITRSEKALRKIHLQRNGDTVIEHLSQPGADQPQAQLIIHLSKP